MYMSDCTFYDGEGYVELDGGCSVLSPDLDPVSGVGGVKGHMKCSFCRHEFLTVKKSSCRR